jgi:hypothetical protein
MLKVNHAGKVSDFRMEFVSTQEFTWVEFDAWKSKLEGSGNELPTVTFIEKKRKELMETEEHQLTEADVEYVWFAFLNNN